MLNGSDSSAAASLLTTKCKPVASSVSSPGVSPPAVSSPAVSPSGMSSPAMSPLAVSLVAVLSCAMSNILSSVISGEKDWNITLLGVAGEDGLNNDDGEDVACKIPVLLGVPVVAVE
jgi:hypothetical protein